MKRTIFWAGDEESFQLILQAQIKLDALMATEGLKAGYFEDAMAKLPPLWSHEGNVAVINISGPVIQGEAGYLRLYGVVGYDDIAKAAINAAMHEDTKSMLYHINSPGGDVAGIADISALLSQISAMKPSAVHSSELMASAGYWLASAVKNAQITVGPTAIIGSIGVLQVHRENSKMLDEMGVKTTVLRSGQYKAEVNSVEPLSPEAKARAESQLADVHAMFRAAVGKARPNLSTEDLADVTQGQTFLGKRAVQAGLADKVGSFTLALKLLDNGKQSRDTSSNSKGKTMKLTPEQFQAMLAASGAAPESFGFKADGSEMTAAEIDAYNVKVAADAAGLAAKIAADAAAATAAAAAAGSETQIAEEDKGVVALLERQLATAQAEVTSLKIAATAHTAMAASHDGLLAIARKATANMLIPLGGSSAAVDGMDAAAVIAEHARAQPLFLEKFKVGQQSQSAQAEETKAPLNPVFLARVATLNKSK